MSTMPTITTTVTTTAAEGFFKEDNTEDEKEDKTSDEQTWYDLYTWLLPLVEMWVRDAGVLSWSGQHKEVSEDIAHEAVLRTFRYNQRADQGEMPPIGSVKALCRIIARNYFRDWRKKDYYLVRPTQNEGFSDIYRRSHELVDPSQIALDRLLVDSTLFTVAQIVARFPQGQRVALLTDLANMSDFDGQPTRLERALLSVGLRLSDYKRPRPTDPSARGRDAALRSIAYKRLRNALQA